MTPGYKTKTFWLMLAAMVLSTLFASGVLGDGGLDYQIAGLGATVLGALGYSVNRTSLKKDANGKPKSALKSTEFWLATGAMLTSAAFASGLVGSGTMTEQIVGGVAAVLAALGYTVDRKRLVPPKGA